MTARHRRRLDQSGMVSILVTMILMLVITLIVIGFAQVSRREQSETLDRQLSSQAFFAAESAVNDARETIRSLGGVFPDKISCAPDSTYTTSPIIDAVNNVSYPCLLVTSKIKNIHLDPVTALGNAIHMPVKTTAPMARLHLNWGAKSCGASSTPCNLAGCPAGVPVTGDFPKAGAWPCPYGVLRVDFVPTATLTRAALAAGKTVFFYPTTVAQPALNYAAASTNGAVKAMYCRSAGDCNVDITISGTYALRVSGIYNDGIADLTAFDAANTPLDFTGAQIKVDATGKAKDVLRRIQVRLPITPAGNTPDYAVESASSICKRFEVNDVSFKISGIVGQDQNNPMCRPTNITP